MKSNNNIVPRSVQIWLIVGLVMIFVQVVVGGITRLTGSGLSITKWDIVIGSVPPLNQIQWEEAFDLYKETPQYQKINVGMNLSSFKWIYFWEFIHRLWARSMGFVFVFPFLYFFFRGYFPKNILRRLGIVFFLAALVASFGWIMVKSGLYNRPWVNAYKLSMHLSLAFILYGYLLWTVFIAFQTNIRVINNSMLKRLGIAFTVILSAQIFIGGVVSGMKAGLFFPTWPDMNGMIVPNILLDYSQWSVDNFVSYDKSTFMVALVQFLHRFTAYMLIIIGLYYIFHIIKQFNYPLIKQGGYLLITLLITQALLGIFTVINCKGSIPITLGVLHQVGALLLLSAALFLNYQLKSSEQ